jgi:hypothetical protein
VTWAGLEDALQGIRQDWENLQQPTLTERVVIEMSSQTDPVVSYNYLLFHVKINQHNILST